jgi:hypothetical protein
MECPGEMIVRLSQLLTLALPVWHNKEQCQQLSKFLRL